MHAFLKKENADLNPNLADLNPNLADLNPNLSPTQTETEITYIGKLLNKKDYTSAVK